MNRSLTTTLSVSLLVAACSGSSQTTNHGPGEGLQDDAPPPAETTQPSETAGCDEQALPPCPPPCAKRLGELAGQACGTEGERCGSHLGSGCTCVGGTWQCSPHAPLKPKGCNQVCRREAP